MAFARALTLLFARGLLLWAVVPVGICVWLLAAVPLRRRGVGLGRFLGWLDLNLVALVQRTVLRPLFPSPLEWTRWGAAAAVTHRLHRLDPA